MTKVSRDENLAMIADSVAYCRSHEKYVTYDAEHFFDAWREDSGYATECLRVAATAGAANVTLCDTNGSSLPDQVAEAISCGSEAPFVSQSVTFSAPAAIAALRHSSA